MMTRKEEDAWCAARRRDVEQYLSREKGLRFGEIGEWPAWHVPPYVSIWAVASMTKPETIGWWVISGDLPTDYCSAEDCGTPRLAIEKIARNWDAALRRHKAGDRTIGKPGIDAGLAPLLRTRADRLLAMVAKPELWPDGPVRRTADGR